MSTVVVIEDEPDLRRLIVEELVDHGHKVIEAANGEQGLAAILAHKPRYVCCDINMPVMNGFALRQALHGMAPGLTDMTFIFITARADKRDIADGLMLGADHYLTKPINMDQLVQICAK